MYNIDVFLKTKPKTAKKSSKSSKSIPYRKMDAQEGALNDEDVEKIKLTRRRLSKKDPDFYLK